MDKKKVPGGGGQNPFQGMITQEDWRDGDSTDEENAQWINIKRILKVISRDNPNDPFKTHSNKAILRLVEDSKARQLTPQELKMLQNYGADLDMCTPFDETDPAGANTTMVSKDSKVELAKLPTWLRTFVESRFSNIREKYGNHTHVFLQMLANRVEYRKMKFWSLLAPLSSDDAFKVNKDERDDIFEEGDRDEEEADADRRAGVNLGLDPFHQEEMLVDEEDQDPELWSPILMQRAADALRAVLLAGASDSEGEAPGGDDWDDNTQKIAQMRDKRKGLVLHKEDEFVYKGPHWEDVIAEREHFKEKARWEVEMEFTPKDKKHDFFMKTCLPLVHGKKGKDGPKLGESKSNKKLKDNPKPEETKSKKKLNKPSNKHNKRKELNPATNTAAPDTLHAEELETPGFFVSLKTKIRRMFEHCGLPKAVDDDKNNYYSFNPGHPLYRKPKGIVSKKARMFRERGVGKRPSRIYIHDECKGPITSVTRELHQVRPTEGLHAYVNFLTGSSGFRYFIMFVILFNAVLLAAETGERTERYGTLFNVFDSTFLSIYLVEFVLKLYSNPVQYFQSAFNCFDLLILTISFAKAGLEWYYGEDIPILRFFIIVRALRILRGVSLSIHTQVLVTALVETLRHHVLSVVTLLILLMYIAAIVAFYFFSEKPELNSTWGQVPMGMLRLFSFVTMDGWTEIMEEFENADMVHEGRTFCLVCIVLGNFLFSNIFIAIIIMQISEATDNFRKAQTDERQSSVFLKQESVYRRQKLDMRQLLARQKLGVADDFYELGSKFVRRLRHDDLVDNRSIIFSPLWIDSLYKGMKRTHHTSNILMTLHRKMADRLVKLNNLYNEGQYTTRGISRARYNRYIEVKAKLTVLKELFLDLREVPSKQPLKVRLPNLVTTMPHATPPPKPPPMPSKPKVHK